MWSLSRASTRNRREKLSSIDSPVTTKRSVSTDPVRSNVVTGKPSKINGQAAKSVLPPTAKTPSGAPKPISRK